MVWYSMKASIVVAVAGIASRQQHHELAAAYDTNARCAERAMVSRERIAGDVETATDTWWS